MLTKLPRAEFIPGTPEQAYRAEYTVCTPEPGPPGGGGGGGHWETICTTIDVFLGWDNGPASWDNPGPFPKPVYASVQNCRSEWVNG